MLGAGEGWAKSILFNSALRDEFQALLRAAGDLRARRVQRLPEFAALQSIIPGTAHWPRFVSNRCEQYESRFTLVEVLRSPSAMPGRTAVG